MNKYEVHSYVIDTYFPNDNLVVMEIGRIRYSDPSAKFSDGWSTLAYVNHPRVNKFVSFDIDKSTKSICDDIILTHGLPLYHIGSPLKYYDDWPNDILANLLFIDATNDAKHTWDIYLECLDRRNITNRSLILIDDVLSPEGRKGDIIIPSLVSKYDVIELDPYILLRPKTK